MVLSCKSKDKIFIAKILLSVLLSFKECGLFCIVWPAVSGGVSVVLCVLGLGAVPVQRTFRGTPERMVEVLRASAAGCAG